MQWQNLDCIEVAFTTYCNANCPLCVRTDKNTGRKKDWLPLIHYDMDNYKKLVDQLDQSVVKKIHLCGDYGDPMMHPQVEQAIDYAITKKKLTVIIDTNGGIRDAEFYQRLGKTYNEKLIICFSIDGFDQDTNNLYRVDVDFEKAKQNCTTFAKSNSYYGACYWKMLVFNHNYHQIDDIAEYCRTNQIIFYFRPNKRRWPGKNITTPYIKNYVELKQKEYMEFIDEY